VLSFFSRRGRALGPLAERRLVRRIGVGVVALVLIAAAFFGGVYADQNYPELLPVIGGAAHGRFDQGSVNAAARTIQAHYYDPKVDATRLSQGSIQGMVQSLGDPYTQYLTPAQYKQQQNLYASRHTGVIGIYVTFAGQRPVISGVIPGSPAQRAGLHHGDVIVSIDGKDTTNMTSEQASGLIRGKAGSSVTLEIQRDGEMVSVPVKREDFTSPSVQSTRLEGGILYIRIYQFAENTQKEFDQQLGSGLPGAKGVVLDLRDNGGGFVSAAAAVISRFVASGEAFETHDRDGVQRTDVAGNHPAANVPLVVLVNGNTASASEIVAGSLEAHHRARLVGVKTFGKGSVQVDYPMPDGGDLHLTIQHWFLPGNKSIDHVGITPDLAVALPAPGDMFDVVEAKAGHASDTQLNEALRLLGG
jgi:carboxyl-terminal processing protease